MDTVPFLTADESSLIQECIHCGLCLEQCPTYHVLGKEADSPRGRITLLRAVDEGLLPDAVGAYYHFDRCLGCLACTVACPAGVQYGNILNYARARQRHEQPLTGFKALVLKAVTAHKWLAVITWFIKLLQTFKLDRLLISLPVLPLSLRRQLAGVPPIQATSSYAPGDLLTAFNCGEQPLGRVALFTGCVMDHWYRSVHDATIRVLRWNGYEVQIFAKQTCCGALHTHIGLADVGSAMARDSLAAVGSDIAAVVVNSAGCGHQLKEHRAAAATYDLYDIAEWLAPRLNQPPKQQLAQVVTYDPPCHLLHAQSISAEPLILLEASCQKLVTVETAEMCCGSGGLYSLYQGQLSAAVTRAKMAKLINSGAEIVATGNPGCHMQLQSGLKMAGSAIAVKHTMEVLDSAYSLDQNYRAVFEFGA